MTSTSSTIPTWKVDLMYGSKNCTKNKVCKKYCENFKKRMIGKYVADGSPFARQLRSAIIPLCNFDYEHYIQTVKKIHKGNAFRDSRKSDKQGYICKQFFWKNYIPDIVEINTSKETRSGGKMRAAYNRSVEDFGGPPEKYNKVKTPDCHLHCLHNWGIFEPRIGYKQGNIITDEKLLAYIRFKRIGNYAVYTSILGHGDYLRHGIMYRLHYAVMEWIDRNKDGLLNGLDFLLYGAIDSGNNGLKQWKKRGLFEGAYLSLK